jgi:hypothetical protein
LVLEAKLRFSLIAALAFSLAVAACGELRGREVSWEIGSDDVVPLPGEDPTGAFQLKTGERISHSRYGSTKVGSEKEKHTVWVTFEADAEPILREASLKELVVESLLPVAMREGIDGARLIVEQKQLVLGVVKISISDSWVFQRRDGYQWEQTFGSTLDWSVLTQELYRDPELELDIPSTALRVTWGSGKYRNEIHTVADPDLSPKEAMFRVIDLMVRQTRCDAEQELQPDYLADANLDTVYIFAYPEPRGDLLKLVPGVNYGLGRQSGAWTCDKAKMIQEVESLDWENIRTWNDLIR